MPGQFAGRIAEIKGDIHVALGETDAARTAYLEAMVTPGAELLDRGFVQMKLADLPRRRAATRPAPRTDALAVPDAARPDAARRPANAPAGSCRQAGEGA